MKTCFKAVRLFAAASFAAIVSCASGDTINVPGDQPTIIDAVYAANPGDTILIQSGVYDEAGQVYVWAPMTLTATNGPVKVHCTSDQEAVAEVASGVTDVAFNGITFERPSANADWMRSFQLNYGAHATFNNCAFQGPANGVGVIHFFGASAAYYNCTFSNFNPTAGWSAAIFVEGKDANSPYSDIIVSNCLFDTGCNSWIRMSPFQSAPRVGAVSVRNTTFKAAMQPQAIAFWTPAPSTTMLEYNSTNALLFQDCSFEGTSKPGGLNDEMEFYYTTNTAPPSLTFSRCNFKAYNSNSKMMYLDLPAPITFENCLFGGGQHETVMTVWGGPPSVNFYYCTMINDGVTAANSQSGTAQSTFVNGWDGGRTFNIVDSLFRCPTNFSAGFVCDPASAGIRNYAVSNSVIDHPIPTGAFAQITLGTGGSTNISLASAFVDPAAGNYQLTDGSPWVNGGIDLGYTLDLADNPRIQGGAPDMGAYESPYGALMPTISLSSGAGSLTITFTGILQSAAQVNGPFTDVNGAVSPLTISVPSSGNMFWRTRNPTP